MKNKPFILLIVLLCCYLSIPIYFATLYSATALGNIPEQIAIAATERYSSVVVTWITFKPTDSSLVKYGPQGASALDFTEVGYMTRFEDPNRKNRIFILRYIHRVTLRGLEPLTKYDYQCGTPSNWSAVMTLMTLGNETFNPVFAVYGDLGTENAKSLPYLINDVKEGIIQGVLHLGDFAYDFEDDYGRMGDKFMNSIQPIASSIPYMTTPGNHEAASNFSHYKFRFSGMPGDNLGFYYSWDVGPVHIISISTEVYFYPEYDFNPAYQYRWLEEDLKMANSPEQRAKHPWIIAMGHRPMYCTTEGNNDDCKFKNSLVRIGTYGLEKLFYDHGVDIAFWGHEHLYERFWPIYDYKVKKGSSTTKGYVNSEAPIHIISGSAGNIEGLEPFKSIQPEWTAFTNSDYSYTRMHVHNGSYIYMEQISVDKGGKIIDEFSIVKEQHHGPYV